jgi:hypothetical protein
MEGVVVNRGQSESTLSRPCHVIIKVMFVSTIFRFWPLEADVDCQTTSFPPACMRITLVKPIQKST